MWRGRNSSQQLAYIVRTLGVPDKDDLMVGSE